MGLDDLFAFSGSWRRYIWTLTTDATSQDIILISFLSATPAIYLKSVGVLSVPLRASSLKPHHYRLRLLVKLSADPQSVDAMTQYTGAGTRSNGFMLEVPYQRDLQTRLVVYWVGILLFWKKRMWSPREVSLLATALSARSTFGPQLLRYN